MGQQIPVEKRYFFYQTGRALDVIRHADGLGILEMAKMEWQQDGNKCGWEVTLVLLVDGVLS